MALFAKGKASLNGKNHSINIQIDDISLSDAALPDNYKYIKDEMVKMLAKELKVASFKLKNTRVLLYERAVA